MTDLPATLRMRRRRRAQESPAMRITGLGCALAASILTAAILVTLTGLYATLSRDLPSPEMLSALLDPPGGTLLEPTRLYDRLGEQVLRTLAHPGSAGKQFLPLDKAQAEHIPPELVAATITASDPSFWSHPGYQFAGVRSGDHPTLAQRLVADLLLDREPPGWQRAFRERILAAQITARYGREKILEWFLNSANYGNLAYGVDAAARVYFGKSASSLNLAEAAVLAAVAEAPALNPLDTPEEALQRGREILAQMLETGAISTAAFRQAMAEEPTFQEYPPPGREPHAAFTDLVLAQLVARLGRERVERGGLKVITSLDYELQLQADCALRSQLAGLEKPGGAVSFPSPAECPITRLLPQAEPAERDVSPALAGEAVILNPETGEILALAGEPMAGISPEQMPDRPPGSLLTTFVHLAAYTRGLSPASLSWDIPSEIPASLRGDPRLPEQFRGPMRLRMALANDDLGPSLHLLEQIGPENTWINLPQIGLPSLQIPGGPGAIALLLDGGQASLLEMTHAYSVFSNLGLLAGVPSTDSLSGLTPAAILRIEQVDGGAAVDISASQTRPVISAQLAYLVHSVLSDETARWPTMGHPNLLEIGVPSGAKIGQTSSGQDTWTIGYTTRLAVGVWVGLRDQNPDLPYRVPKEIAPALWHALIQYASREFPAEEWEIPPGISEVEVCDPSGLLPTPECENVVSEVFLAGNEPVQQDSMYREIQINRETGRLATIFTPPELIESQVFLIVPPEAASWAAESGLPTPPDSYDLIFAPPSQPEGVRIVQPVMFGYVRGLVLVRGTASGTDFDYYRLQYGRGLNPMTWVQLGEDADRPVSNGVLSQWDTTGLSGLYAVKLQVVRSDQRVETAVIQVTVDNQPPEVVLLNPVDGQELGRSGEAAVVFRARASDDLALDKVEFYLDDELLASLSEAPFAVPWQPRLGTFTLRVVGTDEAGNTAESEARFTVGSEP